MIVNITNLYSDILNQIRTSREANDLIEQIDQVLSDLFRTHGSVEILLKERLGDYIAEAMRKAFEGSGLSLASHDTVRSFLTGLRDRLKRLRTLKLTLAFEPSQKTVDKLISWVRDNFGKDIVLEIANDATILAGAIVVFEGAYIDGTIKTLLEKAFENNRAYIESLLS